MKRSILAIFLAVVMVLFCACGTAGDPEPAEKLPVPETPAGWAKHVEGPIHVFYPAEGYEEVAELTAGVVYQVMDNTTGANINIVKSTDDLFDVDDLTEAYVDTVLDGITSQLDAIYEASLGVTCETSGKNRGFEKKVIGNEKCACIEYSVEVNVPDYGTSLVTEFYQVLYCDSEASYTVTYTCFIDDGSDAKTYFADALELLFVE